MNRIRAKYCAGLMTLLVSFLADLFCPVAQAQVASVTALQRITEKRAGAAGVWRQVKSGAVLNVDDRFRTGKRSKADIKFTDGSLLRLGQLSSVEIRDNKQVNLLGGQVLFSHLQPGKILAGTATGEITGSVGIVTLNADGSSEFSLFSGVMKVVAPQKTVDLPPGHWVSALPDGTLSEVKVAPPLEFAFGELMPELTEDPIRSPYVGSEANLRFRSQPERAVLDLYTPGVNRNEPIPFEHRGQPTPQPTEIETRNASLSNAKSFVPQFAAPSLNHRLRVVQGAPPDSTQSHGETGPLVNQAVGGAGSASADHHMSDINRNLGHFAGGDVGIFAALTDGGTKAYGGRLHGFLTKGQWYLDVMAVPLKSRQNSAFGRIENDLSSVPSASLTYRNSWGDVQIGRQRFLAGPIQASLFGSMIRPGMRSVMDAVRVRPNLGRGRKVEVAYIHDAFVRNLPFRQSGNLKGFYGRAAMEQSYGNFGLNLLKYQDVPGPDTTGATVDFAVPVVRDQIEFYGELGRDPFKRRLTTVGLAFPVLHDRADIDLFLEYARLRGNGPAPAQPNEIALRAFRVIGRNTYVVTNLSRFSNANTVFTLGLSFGARSYKGVQHH